MRDRLQLQHRAHLRPFAQVVADAAVILPPRLLEAQDRHELRLGKLLGAEAVRERRQRPPRPVVSHPGQRKSAFRRP